MSGTMKKTVVLAATLATAFVAAGSVWFVGADGVRAPEPARLNTTLNGSDASSAVYINTHGWTWAYFVSSSWTPSSIPAGYPCSTTYPLAAGTTLYKSVYASGNYRRCA